MKAKTLVSSFFITFLIALAFKSSVDPIWDIFERVGISPSIEWLLPWIFGFTTIRFFIGNQLHLLKLEEEANLSPSMWILDFSAIFLESFTLVFAGRTCSLSISLNARTGIFFFIGFLLFLDVVWICLLWLLGRVRKNWKRKVIPWAWALLNFPTLIVLVVLAERGWIYTNWGIALMAVLLTVSAVIDLAWDYYGLFKRREVMGRFMRSAIEQAKISLGEGGIPIGAVLVKKGKIIAKGHNRRVQDNNPIAHAEIVCLQNGGRIGRYEGTILYSTLMPCYLCAGAIVQFGIKKVIVGEAQTFRGDREFMKRHGVKVIDLNIEECKKLMSDFIQLNPKIWSEDIGEV